MKSISPELLMMLVNMGPCQPISHELVNKKFPIRNGRSFSENYYYKDVGNGKKVQRFWLSRILLKLIKFTVLLVRYLD